MTKDVLAWLGVIFAGIAAFGAIRFEVIRHRERPYVSLAARILPKADYFDDFGGRSRRRVVIRNFGTSTARGVEVHPFGFTIATKFDGTMTDLAPGQQWRWHVEVDDTDVALSWMLVTYSSGRERHGRQTIAWIPLDERGELARLRSAQLDRSTLRRLLARYAIPHTALPISAAENSSPAHPVHLMHRSSARKPPSSWRHRLALRWASRGLPEVPFITPSEWRDKQSAR